MVDGGYAVRRVAPAPLDAAFRGVTEICSVSDCISQSPEQWINRWLYNDFGWFNGMADAVQMIPEDVVHRLFAYRVHGELFRRGQALPLVTPANVTPDPIPETFQTIGFDAVSRSETATHGFDCSPLSCNSMAAECSANEHCLFPTLETAIAAARRFSILQPEPGDYFVVEVLEGQVAYAEPAPEDFAGPELQPGEPNMIDEYKEWAANRYNPGHYLGGTIEPHLRKYALGPRARRVSSVFIGFGAAIGVGVIAAVLLMGDAAGGPADLIFISAYTVLVGAAAWKMAHDSPNSPRGD
jgi:hypothetical protein